MRWTADSILNWKHVLLSRFGCSDLWYCCLKNLKSPLTIPSDCGQALMHCPLDLQTLVDSYAGLRRQQGLNPNLLNGKLYCFEFFFFLIPQILHCLKSKVLNLLIGVICGRKSVFELLWGRGRRILLKLNFCPEANSCWN